MLVLRALGLLIVAATPALPRTSGHILDELIFWKKIKNYRGFPPFLRVYYIVENHTRFVLLRNEICRYDLYDRRVKDDEKGKIVDRFKEGIPYRFQSTLIAVLRPLYFVIAVLVLNSSRLVQGSSANRVYVLLQGVKRFLCLNEAHLLISDIAAWNDYGFQLTGVKCLGPTMIEKVDDAYLDSIPLGRRWNEYSPQEFPYDDDSRGMIHSDHELLIDHHKRWNPSITEFNKDYLLISYSNYNEINLRLRRNSGSLESIYANKQENLKYMLGTVYE